MTIERRVLPVTGIRVIDDAPEGKHRFWARTLNYNVLDDYKTEWAPGVFNASLDERMPCLAYGHNAGFDLRSLVGRGIDYKDQPDGLDNLFEMDDFDDVPGARQFWSQLKSGTINEFSVGFSRQEDVPSETFKDIPGARRIEKGWLQEVSGVMSGAVPGTKLLAMSRSKVLVVPTHVTDSVLSRMALGEMDLADALVEIRSSATEPQAQPEVEVRDGEEDSLPVLVDVDDLVEVGKEIALLDAAGVDVASLTAAFDQLIHSDIQEDEAEAQDGVSAEQLLALVTERAKWSTKTINALPDDAFAYVIPGGTRDDSGLTLPRSNRKFPHHFADGKTSANHLRTAKDRIAGSDLPQAAKDKATAHINHHTADPAWEHGFKRQSAVEVEVRDDSALDAETDALLSRLSRR